MKAHRKALTISLTVDKDTSIGRPLKLSKSCHTSGCGKLEAQIHWSKTAGYQVRYPDSQHTNGNAMFDLNQKAIIGLGMASKNPCLILKDVLETESGRAYLGRKRCSQLMENGGRVTGSQKNGQRQKGPQICRDRRSDHREDRKKEKERTVIPQYSQKTLSSVWKKTSLHIPDVHNTHSPRRRLEREAKNERKYREARNGKECTEAEASQVDQCAPLCDSEVWLSGEPGPDHPRVDELAPGDCRDRSMDPACEERQSTKRKNTTPESNYNGVTVAQVHRGSVLHHSGDGKSNGEPARKHLLLEDSGGHSQSDGPNRVIVRITVGGARAVEGNISPSIGSPSGVQKDMGTLRLSQDNSSPSEPIVLSSDESEAGEPTPPCSNVIHPLVCVGEPQSLETTPPKDVLSQEEIPDMQVLHVVVEDEMDEMDSGFVVSNVPSPDDLCINMAFYALHSGGYKGHANGNILMATQRLIIPLKGNKQQVPFSLILRGLRGYGLWEQHELQARGLQYMDDEHRSPALLLFLLVSYDQAVTIQTVLRKVSGKEQTDVHAGTVSPFLLLSLKDHLEGIEMAVLRSSLEIACLNNVAQRRTILDLELENIQTPDLSLDSTLHLIRQSGLDPQLLRLLGQDRTSPGPDKDLCDPQTGSVAGPNTGAEGEAEPVKGESAEQMEEQACPNKKSQAPAEPVYTLCHHRTGGSYRVSLSKPDASWTPFKHQGQARRLIQFPPPPSKGGITVTMEDLQCLDSGQYLNDVIIDFYLKYLLHKTLPAMAERSHVFSSFFYKQLTRRDNASEDSTSASQRQRRHQRVKTWTRHVDIFKKDFLFVPVNQEAHWYLVVICFPGLEEPCFECRAGSDCQETTGNSRSSDPKIREEVQTPPKLNGATVVEPTLLRTDESVGPSEKVREGSTDVTPPAPPNCTEQTCRMDNVCKRPCILIMDSLKLSLHERIFKLLREYLQSEWEVRRGSVRDFSAEQMKSSHCRVPLQDNCSDCGLYLLQYVESFLKDPVVHFDLPLRLERWFPRQQVRRKRDEIRDLIIYLYRQQEVEHCTR